MWCATRLAGADFELQRQAGFDHKREMLTARHAPHHRAAPSAGRRYGAASGPVVIVGAGLAGAAAAHALATLGVPSRVLDAAATPAEGGSGSPQACCTAWCTPTIRRTRAGFVPPRCARSTVLAPLVANGAVRGRLDGLLRIERELDHAAMQRVLDAQRLPADYVQALSPAEAAARAGCAVGAAAWWYPGGGWIDPRSLVRHWLDDPLIELVLHVRVARIARNADAWHLLDAGGGAIAAARTLVLANADGIRPLLHGSDWTLLSSRGQVTWLPEALPNWQPAVPVAGDGYAIALDGGVLCGATSDIDDSDPALRESDHRRNLDALQRLSGQRWSAPVDSLGGRVAWRVHTRDRLPLLGGVPLPASDRALDSRQDQPRFIARAARPACIGRARFTRPGTGCTRRRSAGRDDHRNTAADRQRTARCGGRSALRRARRARSVAQRLHAVAGAQEA